VYYLQLNSLKCVKFSKIRLDSFYETVISCEGKVKFFLYLTKYDAMMNYLVLN
jgi:hypothetical protein